MPLWTLTNDIDPFQHIIWCYCAQKRPKIVFLALTEGFFSRGTTVMKGVYIICKSPQGHSKQFLFGLAGYVCEFRGILGYFSRILAIEEF